MHLPVVNITETMLARVLLAPVAKALVFLLERNGAERSLPVLAFSAATTLLACVLLYFTLVQNPYSSWLKLALIALLLLSALSGEVLHRMSQASEVKRTLDSVLDFAVYFTALYFLPAAMYLPQFVPWVTRREYLLLFLLLAAGAVMHRMLGGFAQWLSARSERLLLYSLILVAGFYTNFETAVLTGVVAISLLMYISLLGGRLRKPGISAHLLRPVRGLPLLLLRVAAGFALLLRRGAGVAAGAAGLLKRRRHQEPELSPEEPEEPYRGHRFTVMVTDEMENPVEGARVVLHNMDTGLEEVRISDSGGRCRFEGLVPGEYMIVIDGEGIAPEKHRRYISMDQGEVFAVRLRSSDLSVVVSQRELGTPVRDALVKLSGKNFHREARTNNLGVAYFDSLEMGEYLLEVEAEGYRSYSRPVSLFSENVVAVPLEPLEERAVDERAEKPLRERETQEEAPERRGLEEREPVMEKLEPEEEEVIFGESALIEYSSDTKLEDVVAGIVSEHVANGRDVFLVSMQPRTSKYRQMFSELMQEGRVRVINLATRGKPPESDSGIEEVPISNLEYFSAVFEEMPAGALLVFEPLSSVILTVGAEHAYRFVSRTVEHLSNEGLFLICFINREMHSARELSSFRELFMNVAEIRDGKIRRTR
ncbi:carboxypeptidase regulatory-like domain-containing protein [Candidatus Pyrohabitans sp.]